MQQQTQQEEAQSWQVAPTSTTTKSDETLAQSSETSKHNYARMKATVHDLHHQALRRHIYRITSGLSLCLIGLMVLAFSLLHSAFYFLNIILPLCFLFYFRGLAGRQEAKSRSILESIKDLRLVGPLAQALDAEKTTHQSYIAGALCRLLPRLQASDASLLNKEQRACLNSLLTRRRLRHRHGGKVLILAILKALEQIGDKDALPAVQKLAQWSSDKDIRQAANNCLPYLHDRAEAYKRGAMYLRPADARTSGSDVLLRSSTSMTQPQQTPPDQLLRAHNEE